jgi:heat shock protein 1/8
MESRSTSKIAIGIDLGTSNSCVGVVLDGKVEIIADDQGDRTTPSYVAFITETAELVGEAAKEQQSSNPKNTVYGIKRLIGRKFDDAAVALDKDHWPFAVTADDNGKPMVKIDFEGGHKLYSPEEISSKILIRMKVIYDIYDIYMFDLFLTC